LGEIESHLLQHPGVKETVVQAIAHPKGGKRLVAYVVLDETMQEATEQAPDAYLPTDQDGVLLDPVERLEFKLHQPGIRLFNGANPKRFCLPAPDFDATLRDAYLSRQSYRQFMEDSIPLHEFSAFLSCLRQMPVANTPLPKYRYPSAGGLYPVQTYLYIKPERVAGLAGGYYYYQPAQHELVWLSAAAEGRPYLQAGVNQPIVEAGAFCLFLIGAMDAIEPMYGEMGRDFSLLEAGYISQLLMMEAPVYQLGLCPVSAPDDTDLPIALGLTVSQPLLHSLVGGCIEPKQRTQWLVGQQKPAAVSWSVQLESHLAKKLPDYMVPSTFVPMASLPLTANGKINRQALPEPDISALRADHDFVPPRTTTEEQLAAMWVEILRLDQAGIRAEGAQPDDVGIHSNFFECGGDSLLAVQLITRVREAFAVELPVRSLFASPTIAGIAELIENTLPAQAATATQHDTALKWQRVPPHLITIQPGENKQGEKKTPFFCVHPVAGIVFPYYDLATALGTEQPFYGLQSVGIAGEEAPLKRVEEMAAHHITAIKAIQPMGPYQVGGWSFGGLVAFEIAQQLHRAGNPVSLLVLLDTPALIGDRRHIWWLKFKLFAAVVPRYIWPYINDYLTLLVSAERQRNPHVAKRTLPRLDAGQRPHKVGRVHQLMESAKLVKRAIRRPDVRQMLKVMQANSVASGGYTPSAYPNRLTLLHTESSRALFSPTDPTLGWGQLVAGGVTVQRVPGHHMNFLRHPHVGEVAATLSACLTHALVVGD
jgi:SagB-type dehydrogenase family enzyme